MMGVCGVLVHGRGESGALENGMGSEVCRSKSMVGVNQGA